jgi:hypothetical protein
MTQLSSCCNAPIVPQFLVSGYYICNECGTLCDLNTTTPPVEETTQHTPESEIEEMKKKYNEMWEKGEFEWNHHEGDKLGKKPISPERIWNVFVEPTLDSIADRIATKAYERGKAEGEKIGEDRMRRAKEQTDEYYAIRIRKAVEEERDRIFKEMNKAFKKK